MRFHLGDSFGDGRTSFLCQTLYDFCLHGSPAHTSIATKIATATSHLRLTTIPILWVEILADPRACRVEARWHMFCVCDEQHESFNPRFYAARPASPRFTLGSISA